MSFAHHFLTPLRRTKIVGTLGPSTDSPEVIRRLLVAGLDVARINFSHNTSTINSQYIQLLRDHAHAMGKTVAIMADLQGPKIRIAGFQKGHIHLNEHHLFTLDATMDSNLGNENAVGLEYTHLPDDVCPGDELLLDDGRIVLRVEAIEQSKVMCRVIHGGMLSDYKGINRKGGGLSAPTLTSKDYEDMATAVALQCHYIAISFPRSPEDIYQARQAMQALGGEASIIAKIERAEVLNHLDEIIIASDGIMVARGDLGVEIGEAEVPAVQKHIIQRTRALNKVVITATQMMESMIHQATPTRAEVSDIANAVLDGTDAVMLSAETATGKHPGLVVDTMARICLGAEKQPRTRRSHHRVSSTFQNGEEAIAMAAMYIGNHFDIKGIVAFTETGATSLWMSRIRSGIPIYGFTASINTQHKMALYRGVYPFYLDLDAPSSDRMQNRAIKILKAERLVQPGECVLVTYGFVKKKGGTNTIKLLTVP